MQYYSTLKAKLIYVFTINDSSHRDCVKIGETTLNEATDLSLAPNCKELNQAARHRIDQYTKTAGISYTLHHTELTVSIRGGVITSFNDKEVHSVLLRSGVKRKDFGHIGQGREWFECTVETALKAIKAAKEGRSALDSTEIVEYTEVIEFRPEQRDAIDRTVKKFTNGGTSMLWNAKMRFGKTLSALQVVKECRFRRTLILTHRPVVDAGWFEDFGKIFNDNESFMIGPNTYHYGSREKGFNFKELESSAKKDSGFNYVYFASMQDLRGAKMVGGKFDKNVGIFSANYDLIIIDEAHEGTQTELGKNVITSLRKEGTRVLNLSGTPFNLLDDYKEDEIFTWDYVMEQKAKEEWDLNHFGDPNPYAGLPRLNIFTFDLGKAMSGFEDVEDSAFNFKEFFRTWTGDKEKDHREMPAGMEGRFVHEEYVKNFLDLIVKYDPESNYPFSTVDFRNSFRHTLWMIPGVKEARALSSLLQQHDIFGQFQIVNVAGDGDEDVPDDNALSLVEKAMGNNPEDTRTITLSCGKLTTGVSVKPWTAVMMLSGSHNTDAKAYMQTIFRVQTPYTTKDGRRKENCYVFDFAPDRTLKVLADTAKVSTKTTANQSDRTKLGEFLNFCPVIGYDGTKMGKFNVENMLEQLKRAYISRITRNGCDDDRLYNQEMLLKLDKDALEKFKGLHSIIGATKSNHTSTDVDVNDTGLTNEQYEEKKRLEKKTPRERTEEEKRRLEELKEKKKNANAAISILRGISIRLPLLMYGAELTDEEQDVTLENFVDLIDDQSWEEFMPRGVTKELFREFIPYYDPDMFRAVGRSYRDLVRSADKLPPMERTREIARIFSYFRNPDKETVLTPWRVVNMHIGDCIGGQVFFDEDNTTELPKPRYVSHGEVTENVFKDKDTRILEINSKTGLYPLYMTYSVFAEKLKEYRDSHKLATDVPLDVQNQIWDEVLRNNIFVICKTEMAKSITKRTLRGFRSAKVNARYFENLINKITNQTQLFIKHAVNGRQYWKNPELEDNMKFNAIVGNPPYQLTGGSGGTNDSPIYQHFCQVAKKIKPNYISFVIPARWFAAGRDNLLGDFRKQMLNDGNVRKLITFEDSKALFSNVEIKGGCCYYMEDMTYQGDCEYTFVENNVRQTEYLALNAFDVLIRNPRLAQIVKKVNAISAGISGVDTIISADTPFGIPTKPTNNAKVNFILHDTPISSDYVSLYYIENLKRHIAYIDIKHIKKNTQDIGKPKVFIPEAGGSGNDPKVLGVPEYAPSNTVCSQSYLYAAFTTDEEAINFEKYIRTKFLRALVSAKKITQHATNRVYGYVPLQDFTSASDIEWNRSVVEIDKQLYAKYGLTDAEIAFIEAKIKPIGGDDNALFDKDDYIDPEFATFSLEEHGVKVGDVIVYTPTNTELVVAEDNKVKCGEDIFTLAEFTAKFMPRNKRSVSGVCQGPKYFTYNGMTLYKLKESFGK